MKQFIKLTSFVFVLMMILAFAKAYFGGDINLSVTNFFKAAGIGLSVSMIVAWLLIRNDDTEKVDE